MASRSVNRWSRLFQAISKYVKTKDMGTVKLIGEDHLGNKYFEAKRPNHNWRPVQRYYEGHKKVDSFDHLIEVTRVPPAWQAWLSFRRQDPPSELEIQESEEYFKMQQDMASSKKGEKQKTDSNEDSDTGPHPKKKVLPHHYR